VFRELKVKERMGGFNIFTYDSRIMVSVLACAQLGWHMGVLLGFSTSAVATRVTTQIVK
jgi:hypothetical protein